MKLTFDNVKSNELNRALSDAGFNVSVVEVEGSVTSITFLEELLTKEELVAKINSSLDLKLFEIEQTPDYKERLEAVELAVLEMIMEV